MTNSKADYFGLSRVASIILAIIPITNWICGIVTRFQDGKVLAGILRIIPFCALVCYWVDLIMMIASKHIWRLL